MSADTGSARIDLAREADFRLGGLLVRPSTRQVESGGKSETLQPRTVQDWSPWRGGDDRVSPSNGSWYG